MAPQWPLCANIFFLTQSRIKNVDVEIRESLFTPLAGSMLLVSTFSDPTVDVRAPLTPPTLGFGISSKDAKYAEDTSGLFVAEGGTSKKNISLNSLPRALSNEQKQ